MFLSHHQHLSFSLLPCGGCGAKLKNKQCAPRAILVNVIIYLFKGAIIHSEAESASSNTWYRCDIWAESDTESSLPRPWAAAVALLPLFRVANIYIVFFIHRARITHAPLHYALGWVCGRPQNPRSSFLICDSFRIFAPTPAYPPQPAHKLISRAAHNPTPAPSSTVKCKITHTNLKCSQSYLCSFSRAAVLFI